MNQYCDLAAPPNSPLPCCPAYLAAAPTLSHQTSGTAPGIEVHNHSGRKLTTQRGKSYMYERLRDRIKSTRLTVAVGVIGTCTLVETRNQ